MALYYELPVYQDLYPLVLRIFKDTKQFPPEYKHTPGQDIKRDGLVLVRSIYRANKHRDKEPHLRSSLRAGKRGAI